MSYPVMPYAAAHKWEPMAAKRGVSKVARSSRGFMRAYQRAGSWAKLSPEWKAKRNAFVARHMAQGKSEKLWKNGQPSRRALALIMWAYMPPGRPSGVKPNPPATQHHRKQSSELYDRELQHGILAETFLDPSLSEEVAEEIARRNLRKDSEHYAKLLRKARKGFDAQSNPPARRWPVEALFEHSDGLTRYYFHQPYQGARVQYQKWERSSHTDTWGWQWTRRLSKGRANQQVQTLRSSGYHQV
jgi:hypothetical protein